MAINYNDMEGKNIVRIIIGGIIELFSVFYIIGMVIGSYKEKDPLGVTIAIKTLRENGSIDYQKIQKELKISDYKAIQYVLWGDIIKTHGMSDYKCNIFIVLYRNIIYTINTGTYLLLKLKINKINFCCYRI